MSLVCGPPRFRVPVLQVRRRDLQRLADPLAGGESAPAVRRPCGRMRAAVDEDRPVERAHELHAVADDLARDRIQVLQDARAADAAPLVRRRVRPALVLGRAPDRFRRRVGAQTAGFVEREAEVVGQRRLPGILGAVDPPFAGDVRRPAPPWADEAKVDDGRDGNHQHQSNRSHPSPSRHSTFAIRWTHKCADYGRPTPDGARASARFSARPCRQMTGHDVVSGFSRTWRVRASHTDCTCPRHTEALRRGVL